LTAKTAEKIVVALRDKVEKLASRGSVGGKAVTRAIIDADVLEALTSLGYSPAEAKQAIAVVDSSLTDSSERLKAALKQLARK
jgi:Holliday junction resolvasome RuvABC DNA-binding subunit